MKVSQALTWTFPFLVVFFAILGEFSHFSLLGGTSSILRTFLGGTSQKSHPVWWWNVSNSVMWNHHFILYIFLYYSSSFEISHLSLARKHLVDVFVHYSCSVHSLNIQLFHASQVYNACNQITKVLNHYQNSQEALDFRIQYVNKQAKYLVAVTF